MVAIAHAREDRIPCTYQDKKETIKVQLSYLGDSTHIIQMHAPGGEPDRYFARTDGEYYTEFATRLGSYKPLKLKETKKSRLRVQSPYGGNLYSWTLNSKTYELKCQEK